MHKCNSQTFFRHELRKRVQEDKHKTPKRTRDGVGDGDGDAAGLPKCLHCFYAGAVRAELHIEHDFSVIFRAQVTELQVNEGFACMYSPVKRIEMEVNQSQTIKKCKIHDWRVVL